MYKATISPSVERVEVERFTDSSVWIKGRRNARVSSYESYFFTREEALEHLRIIFSSRLEMAKMRLKRAQQKVDALDELECLPEK